MPRIFISYRRDDGGGYAGRLFDHLEKKFGKANIFMDIDSLSPGDDFVDVLHSSIGSCDVLLAVIGKNWLAVTDEKGRRRLDNAKDFVRVEIVAALDRNVYVIPVLVGGAQMPQPTQLPNKLTRLARRQAFTMPDAGFPGAVDRLIAEIDKVADRAQIAEQERLERERAEAAAKRAEEERAVEADRIRRAREAEELHRKEEEDRKVQQDAAVRRIPLQDRLEELRRQRLENRASAETQIRVANQKKVEQGHIERQRPEAGSKIAGLRPIERQSKQAEAGAKVVGQKRAVATGKWTASEVLAFLVAIPVLNAISFFGGRWASWLIAERYLDSFLHRLGLPTAFPHWLIVAVAILVLFPIGNWLARLAGQKVSLLGGTLLVVLPGFVIGFRLFTGIASNNQPSVWYAVEAVLVLLLPIALKS